MLGDKIKALRTSKNMYQQDLANALSVSKSTIAMWETNKRIPDTSMLVKVAEYFDVTVDYLLAEERRKSAIQKYGFCYSPEEIDNEKNESRKKIGSGTLSDEEIIKEAINIYKALFSRSLSGCLYNTKHVSFDDYCAMMLNQEQRSIYGNLSDDKFKWLKTELIKKYGKKPGIPDGTYYNLDISKPTLAQKAIKKSLPATGTRSDLLDDIDDLNDEEAIELKGYIKYLKSKRQNQE